jgi:outer membrane immunogenic protein
MQKSLALVATAVAFAVTAAAAADMRVPPAGAYPSYLPPAFVPALPNWSGCYVGANLAGAWGNFHESTSTGVAISANPAGIAGGGQVGCDIQFDSWVFGIRNMIDATNLRSSTSFAAGSANSHTNWFDTLTAREGFLVAPNVLVYGQGGAAWANTNVTVFNTAGGQIGSISNNSQGWTLGGGAEWMFAPHWSVFAEYNFMGFGGNNIQDVAAGVNYRF